MYPSLCKQKLWEDAYHGLVGEQCSLRGKAEPAVLRTEEAGAAQFPDPVLQDLQRPLSREHTILAEVDPRGLAKTEEKRLPDSLVLIQDFFLSGRCTAAPEPTRVFCDVGDICRSSVPHKRPGARTQAEIF